MFAVASFIPVLVISSFGVRQAWGKSLLEVFNDFTVSGRLDLTQELAAADLPVTPFQALALSGRRHAECVGDLAAALATANGVDPAAASAADQDAQALALYNRQGAGPWPHCGVHLSS